MSVSFVVKDWMVIEVMKTRGGSFVQNLGKAAAVADEKNLTRLKTAFPEMWEQYSEMAKVAYAEDQQ